MKRGMIDIETLSSRPDAAVISIGLVGFDEKTILFRDSFAIVEEDWHGHINPATVKWWMEQGKEAQAFSFFNDKALNDKAASERLASFANEYCKDECWANGPQFDLVVLREWWNRVTKADKFPIHYRSYRDCRTIWTIARAKNIHIDTAWAGEIVPHDPGSDALVQAEAVRLAIGGLYANA